ncbi:helix-turn-helix domain-containing protein [Ekhidna sp.]
MKQDYSISEKEILKKFGDSLKELRETNNISQEKLALNCGLDRTYVGSVERGERNISLLNMIKIISAFEMSLASFFKKSDI